MKKARKNGPTGVNDLCLEFEGPGFEPRFPALRARLIAVRRQRAAASQARRVGEFTVLILILLVARKPIFFLGH